jgi:hypothetical protein
MNFYRIEDPDVFKEREEIFFEEKANKVQTGEEDERVVEVFLALVAIDRVQLWLEIESFLDSQAFEEKEE